MAVLAMTMSLLTLYRVGAVPLERGGTVFLEDGKMIAVEEFTKVLVHEEIIYGEEKGEEREIVLGDVDRIRLLTTGVDYVFDNSKFTKKSGSMEVFLKNGEKHLLNNAYFPEKTFTVKVRDPKTGKLIERKISFRQVREIVFAKGPVIYKRCPSDGRLFPADYLYCPYDKTLLEKVVSER